MQYVINLIKPCTFLSVFVYGLICVALEPFYVYRYFPPIIIVPVCLALIVNGFRLTVPEKQAIEAIVGDEITTDKDAGQEVTLKVAAHRGAGLDVPENTLTAFRVCAEKNCHFIEFDVTLTSDNVPVVFHDTTLERIADVNQNISEMTWQELQTVDVSVKHPFRDRYPNCKIPCLDDTIQQLLDSKQKMFIDLKDNKEQIVNVILEMYEKYPKLYNNAVVSSFFPHIIYKIRRKNPKIVCSLAWKPLIFSSIISSKFKEKGRNTFMQSLQYHVLKIFDCIYEWLLPALIYQILGISFILLHKDVINSKVIADWQSKGVRVVAWTVNHPIEKQYFLKVLKIPYITDTLTGENTVHSS